MSDRLQQWLGKRQAPWVLCCIGLALVSPSITAGLALDDFIHGVVLTNTDTLTAYESTPWYNLFSFAAPEINADLQQDGVLAWWADPELRFSFFRPLTALTHALDYLVWPDSPALMHLHTLVYYALSILGLAVLFSSILAPRWVAMFATLCYVLETTHAVAVTWLANRNAVIGWALTSWALVLHVRAQKSARSAPLLLGSAGLLTCALLSGEGAIGGLAYVYAAEVCLAEDTLHRRTARVVPSTIVTLLTLATARALGYGVRGSGAYFDPIADPTAYLRALPTRAVAALGAELSFLPAELWAAYDLLLPGIGYALVVLVLVLGVGWLYLLFPLRSHRAAQFFLLGSVLSAFPALAAPPAGRTLGWVAIGVSGLLALLVAHVTRIARDRRPSTAQRLGLALVGFRVLGGCFGMPAACMVVRDTARLAARAADALPPGVLPGQTVVFINPPQDVTVMFTRAIRALSDRSTPKQLWLATGLTEITLTRSTPTTLTVTAAHGFVRELSEQLVRRRAFAVGETVAMPGARVEVVALTADARPLTARFEFVADLDDPSYLWYAWRDGRFVEVRPPALGETQTLPAIEFADVLFGTGG